MAFDTILVGGIPSCKSLPIAKFQTAAQLVAGTTHILYLPTIFMLLPSTEPLHLVALLSAVFILSISSFFWAEMRISRLARRRRSCAAPIICYAYTPCGDYTVCQITTHNGSVEFHGDRYEFVATKSLISGLEHQGHHLGIFFKVPRQHESTVVRMEFDKGRDDAQTVCSWLQSLTDDEPPLLPPVVPAVVVPSPLRWWTVLGVSMALSLPAILSFILTTHHPAPKFAAWMNALIILIIWAGNAWTLWCYKQTDRRREQAMRDLGIADPTPG